MGNFEEGKNKEITIKQILDVLEYLHSLHKVGDDLVINFYENGSSVVRVWTTEKEVISFKNIEELTNFIEELKEKRIIIEFGNHIGKNITINQILNIMKYLRALYNIKDNLEFDFYEDKSGGIKLYSTKKEIIGFDSIEELIDIIKNKGGIL